MKENSYKFFVTLCVLLVLSAQSQAQITLLQDYVNKKSQAIGVFKGISFREGGFSSLYPISNTGGKEFWTISDRGVNIDAANANPAACHPTYDKLYAFPSYAPKIHKIRLAGDSIEILQTISMKRPDGTTATGLINPTGFGSTALEVPSTDTVNDCSKFASKTSPKDVWGIDSEGIVVDKNGNFWICEEGGPSIWKLSPNGIVMKRYTPYANLPGATSLDIMIDTVYKYRKNNRGFEGIAITPNGKIYAAIQSPILYPTLSIGEATRVHRILEIDPANNAMQMFAYLNQGVIGDKGANQLRLSDWKIGDMAAINDSTFLVIEAALRGTSDVKKIFKISITGATPVTSKLYGTKTLEALVDSAGLAANSIVPVKKTLFLDLKANGWPAALDKSEGLAIINDSTIVAGNDNDYGQASLLADGIPVATGNLSRILEYGLKGKNKITNLEAIPSSMQLPMGISSSQSPYVTPKSAGVVLSSILTVGDEIGGYKMVGIPDGLGAYNNLDGTFTLLMNHEIPFSGTPPAPLGAVRAHGGKGAFVSKWVLKKSDLSVVSGSDLIRTVKLWNGLNFTTYGPGDATDLKNFARFCSADLPEVSAFYNASTGIGTSARIFMNGEEQNDESRAFAHIVTGPEAGTTYELPHLGKAAWENAVASPASGNRTVVALMNDGTDGQVYFYIGSKLNAGSEVDKAGLTNGRPFGIKVNGFAKERIDSKTLNPLPAPHTRFSLVSLGSVENMTGAAFNKASNDAGVTSFSRPEDGSWDPSKPNDFYFNTTDQFDQTAEGLGTTIGRSRVWHVHFDDITLPEMGGTIEAVVDGTEGINMLDNMAIDEYGHIILLEDVGNSPHNGKVWQYTMATDALRMLAQHDSSRFGNIDRLATAPFNQDEETSGIIDVSHILGAGMFLLVDQAHNALPGELVEGGQLLSLFNPDTYNASKMVTAVSDLLSSPFGTSNISLFPNPTGDEAFISMLLENSEHVVINMIDLQGKKVSKTIEKDLGKGQSMVSINTSAIEPGLYFVEITSAGKTTRIKTVVIH